MELTVYGPQTAEEEQELKRRAGAAYARAGAQYMRELKCTAGDKVSLYEEIKKIYRER